MISATMVAAMVASSITAEPIRPLRLVGCGSLGRPGGNITGVTFR